MKFAKNSVKGRRLTEQIILRWPLFPLLSCVGEVEGKSGYEVMPGK
jgi:hypothetical protein